MSRAILALAATVAGLVLLLSFKTHSTGALATAATTASTGTKAAAGTTATTATAAGASPKTRTKTASAATTAAATTKTVAGDVSYTRYGPVQVQVTLTSGRITAVRALQSPSSDSRSQQINAYAIPVLNQEALAAGSASIDLVSGATYTSNGYLASLQSALGKTGA
jgi:uncharacterized protein with FMN-binding domain